MLINRTNQNAYFDQFMKRLEDHQSNIYYVGDTALTVMQLFSFGFFYLLEPATSDTILSLIRAEE